MDPVSNSLSSVIDELGLNRYNDEVKKKDFGQNEFLTLMVAQLKHQSPLEPMQNGEFLTQMAQFSSASGVEKLTQSFDSFAASMQSNQALQASSLVGRNVLIPSSEAQLPTGGSLQGMIDVPQSTGNLTVNIYNINGELVRKLELGVQDAGPARFAWDGLGDNGQAQPPGAYQISAESTIDGEVVAMETFTQDSVESVTIGKGGQGLVLNLGNAGSVSIDQIREIL